MKTYSVKEVADMLNTSEETVRRWIRDGKLGANQTSRKDGNVISDSMLDSFLRNSPKYAKIAAAASTASLAAGGVVLSAALIGNMITHNEKIKKAQVSPYELIRLLEKEISTSENEVKKKKQLIKQYREEVIDALERIEELKKLIETLRDQID